ncbi:Acetate/butyrate--CoA ligase aae7, peroxisomal, partial [Sarracenia purpurea var. burkii]
VAVIAPNIPAIYEAHFGIPMSGAVINPVNIRLNPPTVAFLLEHSSAAVVMVDQEFFHLAEEALKIWDDKRKGSFQPPLLIVIADETCDPTSLKYALGRGAIEYEKFLETGDPNFAWKPPEDEWHTISLGYTSGTTSSPKGVLFVGQAYALRQVTAKAVYSAIANYGVTHFCAAPIVLNTIVNASPHDTILPLPRTVNVMTAGAAPPPSVLSAMSQLGFRVTHTYGLSETYGPCTVCAWKPEWDTLPLETQARLNSRQGVRCVSLEGLDVVNNQNIVPVPADGTTIGEIVMRGNSVMKGYLKNPKANAEAFAGGWFHSGDLGVKHPDGYIEIKDRAKDIIISGGENISSVEIENVLYTHPAVLEASVVARLDERWGESPCAFVALKPGVDKSIEQRLTEDIKKFCRSRMPAYWVPKSVVFGPLPTTATGKVQKNVLRAKVKEMGPVKKSRL